MQEFDVRNLIEPEQVDWDNYEDAQEFKLPPPGEYFAVAPERIEFKATKEGYLMAVIDPIVLRGNPAGDGATIRFTKASVKKFAKSNASMLGHYLRAFGIRPTQQTNQEFVTLAEMTAGRTFKVVVGWRGYCKSCDTEFKNAAAFPVLEGERQSEMSCPNCGADGVRAYLEVKRFVPLV